MVRLVYADVVSDESLWIFGYGSLVWRPAFAHRRSAPASISGYARRFWQGSTDHRGIPSRPGRVVTLLPSHDPTLKDELEQGTSATARADDVCWGSAYEVLPGDRAEVLDGLDHRERGGYERIEVEITIRLDDRRTTRRPGLVYVAGRDNANYLGPAPLREIARQIAGARGPSGANPEYVFELARSLRRMGTGDDHVFEVEAELARHLREVER